MHARLYVARRENRMKQKEVAEKIGMHKQTYHLKECGKRDFSLTEARLLSKLFDRSLDELFGEGG